MTKKALVLVNIGSPTQLDEYAIKDYLNRFLSDKRIIKKQTLVWKIILHLFILRKRPKVLIKQYEQMWIEDKSPLVYYTLKQVKALQKELDEYKIYHAFRYSTPFIHETLKQIQKDMIDEVIIVPLFAQYSATTTASIFDQVSNFYQEQVQIPKLLFISNYYDNDIYINYYHDQIQEKLKFTTYDAIIFSFHNIPEQYVKDGDNYPEYCQKTYDLIMKNIDHKSYLAYQSIFGHQKWLEPQTKDLVINLAKQNYKKILIITPGFTFDCLETIVEINHELKDSFLNSGGETLDTIENFNDKQIFVDMIKAIINK
jgi:ferrochelatase